VAQHPDEMGCVAVETAVKVLKGEPVRPDVTVRIALVTKENANP
jgi:ABC-type sugar transport system substrate-binding protein